MCVYGYGSHRDQHVLSHAVPTRRSADLRREVAGLRLAVPQAIVLEDMDDATARAFEAALSRLSAAGAIVSELPFRELLEIPAANAKGGFAAVECDEMPARHGLRGPAAFTQRVLQHIRRAVGQSAVA